MVTPLPREIGNPCYPILTRDGAMPVIVANSARNEDRIGSNMFFGEKTPAPDRAPAAFMQRTSDPNLPPGTVVSFQGAMFDPGATSPKGASVTNLITLRVE